MRATILRLMIAVLLLGGTLAVFGWAATRPLRIAYANERLLEAAERGRTEEINRALSDGADLNVRDDVGVTPLMAAARANRAEAAMLLLRRHADVSVCVPVYGTALSYAAFNGNADLARALLEAGCDPNADGWGYASPLQLCATSESRQAPAIARLLIEHGADPLRRNVAGDTAVQSARYAGHHDVVQVLIRCGDE